jgi:hypothetical protein
MCVLKIFWTEQKNCFSFFSMDVVKLAIKLTALTPEMECGQAAMAFHLSRLQYFS